MSNSVIEDGGSDSSYVFSSEDFTVSSLVKLLLIDGLSDLDALHDRRVILVVRSVGELLKYVLVLHFIQKILISVKLISFIVV